MKHYYANYHRLNGNGEQNSSDKKVATMIIPIIVSFMFAVICLLFLSTGKLNFGNSRTITELNETYTGKLIITATDIKVIENPNDNNTTIVGVRFEVTNNSNEYYSSVYGIDTYVDDVMVGDYHSHLFNKGNEELYYSGISKGKKVMGYVTAEAYKDSKKVEIVFEEPSLYGNAKKISFVLDIPPVEN